MIEEEIIQMYSFCAEWNNWTRNKDTRKDHMITYVSIFQIFSKTAFKYFE